MLFLTNLVKLVKASFDQIDRMNFTPSCPSFKLIYYSVRVGTRTLAYCQITTNGTCISRDWMWYIVFLVTFTISLLYQIFAEDTQLGLNISTFFLFRGISEFVRIDYFLRLYAKPFANCFNELLNLEKRHLSVSRTNEKKYWQSFIYKNAVIFWFYLFRISTLGICINLFISANWALFPMDPWRLVPACVFIHAQGSTLSEIFCRMISFAYSYVIMTQWNSHFLVMTTAALLCSQLCM